MNTQTTSPSAYRILDAGRISQGFKTQAQLDAWFAYYDASKACKCCTFTGVEIDDGVQMMRVDCAKCAALWMDYNATC